MVLRGEAVALRGAVFPGIRPQVAEADLALAVVQFRDLPELQRVTLAGVAREVVEDAAPRVLHRGLAARPFRATARRRHDAARARSTAFAPGWVAPRPQHRSGDQGGGGGASCLQSHQNRSPDRGILCWNIGLRPDGRNGTWCGGSEVRHTMRLGSKRTSEPKPHQQAIGARVPLNPKFACAPAARMCELRIRATSLECRHPIGNDWTAQRLRKARPDKVKKERFMAKVEAKLAELGVVLPTPASPIANYVGFVRTGSLLVVSGQICLGPDGKLVAKGKLGDTRIDRGRPKGGARLRHQPAGAGEGGARRPRQADPGGSPGRLHQFGADLPRRTEGDERRLRSHGRGARRQGPSCPHHGRRRLLPVDAAVEVEGACSRCRDGRTSMALADARMADRASGGAPRAA